MALLWVAPLSRFVRLILIEENDQLKSDLKKERASHRLTHQSYDAQNREFRASQVQIVDAARENDKFFGKVLALYGIAVATCNCQGCTKVERDYIRKAVETVVLGESWSHLPPRVRKKVNGIFNNAPDTDEAYSTARKAGVSTEEVTELVKILIDAGVGSPSLNVRSLPNWYAASYLDLVASGRVQ